MLNLDTHVLLYAVTGALRSREARLLSADRWSVSAIVLWEIAKLAQLGRIAVDLDDAEVTRVLARVHVWPLTREIARASTRLDIQGDPADELIGNDVLERARRALHFNRHEQLSFGENQAQLGRLEAAFY